MNADGTNQLPVTPSRQTTSMLTGHPAACELVFASNRTGNNEIYVMNADGTGEKRADPDAASERGPPRVLSRRQQDRLCSDA